MPGHAPPVADERTALAAYLTQQQDAFRNAVYGLTDQQAGATPTPSALSLGVLLKHATGVQRAWLATALAAPGRVEDPRPMSERRAAYAEEFAWGEADSVPAQMATFDAVSADVLDAVGRLDLDTPVPVPPAPWNPTDVDTWSVRWVWFHLIEELARHAGHTDIVREALDGATMYALLAGREGWPATDWLTPWHPPVEDRSGRR